MESGVSPSDCCFGSTSLRLRRPTLRLDEGGIVHEGAASAAWSGGSRAGGWDDASICTAAAGGAGVDEREGFFDAPASSLEMTGTQRSSSDFMRLCSQRRRNGDQMGSGGRQRGDCSARARRW
jgi:transcription elongation factor